MIGKWLGRWKTWLSVALIGFSGSAHPAFHAYQITEVYSNASGTVQFIELTALFGGQQFVANHVITSSQGGTTNTFTFPNNLPGDTTGKKFLIGTTGFAALNVVAPDFVVPNGFLFTTNGHLVYDASYDIFDYAALPTDGVLSLNRDMSTGVNSPTNFAGATGTIVPPTTVPGAPNIGTATAGNAQVTVSFSPPSSDGGSAITGYTATCGVKNASGAQSPLTVTGLTNGVSVSCTVIATNGQGNSSPSAPSNNVTPATVPGAPVIGTASAGNAQVTVSFSPPASDGGSAITGYTATCGGQSAGGSASPLTVNGLANGVAVTCTVSAGNAQGTGVASAASNSVTPATVPAAPTIGTATAGNAQVTVNFSSPANNGGSAITGFTATCGTQSASAGGSPITVPGLANGAAVTCRVVASNALGDSAPSSASNSVTPASVPGAPTIGTAIPGNGEAFISFTPPVSNGGSAITGYAATCDAGAASGSGANSPITVGGLANNTLHTCSVTAANAIGSSNASATVDVTPVVNPPLTLVAVRSRKAHTGFGLFDLPIATGVAIGGLVSVEPRTIGSGHTMVFQFNAPVTSFGTVSATPTGSVSALPSGKELVVTLTGVSDNQRVTVSLSDVNGPGVNADASIGFLVGDVSNSRSVNVGDILGVKARLGQPLDSANFRYDLNATGAINASDVSMVKSRSGAVLP